MVIATELISISTRGESEVLDITGKVERILSSHRVSEGIVTVFAGGSTASITTTEFEPGLKIDIPEMLDRVAPRGHRYKHDDTWHDGNGHAHVRAAFLGPSLTVPFSKGKLLLGTWQQIVVIDHDNRPRQRKIIVQVMGR
jgi:secondary thiamine-phosphate synthase enzyme